MEGEVAATDLSVDDSFARETEGQYVKLGCRRKNTDPGNTGYFLMVSPDRGFRFGRNDEGTVVVLVDWRQSPAIPQGSDPMHVELTCARATLTGSVNGALLGSVDDSKYREGRLLIGASAPTGSTADARFQKLLVTQH